MLTIEQLNTWIHEYRTQKLNAIGRDPPGNRNSKVCMVDQTNPQFSILVSGGQETPVVPQFNLGVFSSELEENYYVHDGSAVLVYLEQQKRIAVITAGHVVNSSLKKYALFGGSNQLRKFRISDALRVVDINNYYVDGDPTSPDLAILEAEGVEDIDPSFGLKPLSRDDYLLALSEVEVPCGAIFGWGIDLPSGKSKAHTLQHAVMEPNNFDSQVYTFTCTSFDERGPCEFDSGGPFVMPWRDEIRLAGIVVGNGATNWCHSHKYPTKFISGEAILSVLRVQS